MCTCASVVCGRRIELDSVCSVCMWGRGECVYVCGPELIRFLKHTHMHTHALKHTRTNTYTQAQLHTRTHSQFNTQGNGGLLLEDLELRGLMAHNVFGEACEDPAATACRWCVCCLWWGGMESQSCALKHKDIARVGQNHIYTVYIQYFWQGNDQIYDHSRCIHTVLANPMYLGYL